MPRRPLVEGETRSNVVALPVGRFPVHTSGAGVRCSHRQALIDVGRRSVVCAACGAHLDPYAELDRIARDADWVVAMRREKLELLAELRDLREQRTRARAELRRTARRGLGG